MYLEERYRSRRRSSSRRRSRRRSRCRWKFCTFLPLMSPVGNGEVGAQVEPTGKL